MSRFCTGAPHRARAARKFSTLAWLLVGLVGSPAAAVDLVYTTQDRSVDATATSIGNLWEVGTNPFFPDFDGPSLTQTAPASDADLAADFAPFVANVGASGPGLPFISSTGAASAEQSSELAATAIHASGRFDASRDAYTLDASTLATLSTFLPGTYNFGIAQDSQTADSSFQATFDVSEEADYQLQATLTVSAVGGLFPGDTLSEASVVLRPVGGPALASLAIDQNDFCSATCEPGSASIDEVVTLAPGSYELSANASGAATGTCADIGGGLTCATSPTFASFDVQLVGAAPVPAVGAGARIVLVALLAAVAVGASRRRVSGAGPGDGPDPLAPPA